MNVEYRPTPISSVYRKIVVKNGQEFFKEEIDISAGIAFTLAENKRVSIPKDLLFFADLKKGDKICQKLSNSKDHAIIEKDDKIGRIGRPPVIGCNLRITILPEIIDALNLHSGDLVRFFISEGNLCFDKAIL